MQVSNIAEDSTKLIATTSTENLSFKKADDKGKGNESQSDQIEDGFEDQKGCWQSFRFFLKHSY